MLKYYVSSNQEIKVIQKQLTRQGMKLQGYIPVYDPSIAMGAVHLNVSPIDRTFGFNRLGEGPLKTYMQYTLCNSVTEVLKRTWNTWVPKQIDKGKWGRIYSEFGPAKFDTIIKLHIQDIISNKTLNYIVEEEYQLVINKMTRRHDDWFYTELARSKNDPYLQTR